MSLRIVAGSLKGRLIEVPKGRITRPTSDRIRESLMSSIVSLIGGFDDLCVLDAFAGTGALGLEALSRGASSVCFYEKNRFAYRILVKNCRTCEVDACRDIRLYCSDVFADSIKRVPEIPFDLVFLDPPYAVDPQRVLSLLDSFAVHGIVHDGSVAAYEYASLYDPLSFSEEYAPRWERQTRKVYGDTAFELLRCVQGKDFA